MPSNFTNYVRAELTALVQTIEERATQMHMRCGPARVAEEIYLRLVTEQAIVLMRGFLSACAAEAEHVEPAIKAKALRQL